MSRPRLTNKVIEGIIAMGCVVSCGAPEDAFGSDGPKERRQYDAAIVAFNWAKDMRDYRAKRKEVSK
ncbi:MAG: hypothetical protein L0Z53_09050 [Acidobacteriales bacterium]|nr:hypothetical protein [Terriglobales bacterium]